MNITVNCDTTNSQICRSLHGIQYDHILIGWQWHDLAMNYTLINRSNSI